MPTMPSKKQYDLVTNDEYDTRIPLHSEEAFNHGISFQAKYIGTLDVAKPQSRLEIVAAMRRIRYEFKAKGIKKKKVTIEISMEGVRVILRKKKKKKQWLDEASMVLMQHPVYRIFYVSHDSQDLKIFSYIARDSSNVFKCSVFKSNKKESETEDSPKSSKTLKSSKISKMLKQTRSEEPGPLAEGDKPRKKLSFREPEIMGYLKQNVSSRLSWKGRSPKKKEDKVSQDDINVGRKKPSPLSKSALADDSRMTSPPRSPTFYTQCTNCEKRQIHDALLEDDEELESQAMRVVRTVGQAFDVCHKTTEDDKPSEKDSTLDRKKKDNYSDGLSISDTVRGAESNSTLDVGSGHQSSPGIQRPLRLDLMNLPQQNTQRKSPLGGAGETYSSPLSETLDAGAADTPRASIPSAGTPLGAHHELQLLREQLEQQTQQTQAAVAQVHLLRDQLAAETAARLEAQTRIHQLLVQNKELLDHIAALVQLLQEQERLQQGNQTVTSVPQHMMMGDVSGMYHLPPELGGGGYLSAAPLPSTLSSSYYNLLSGGAAPMIHPGGADLLQRLRSFYYTQHRPGSSSFPGTPILPHRGERPSSGQDDFRSGRPNQDDYRPGCRPYQDDFRPARPSSMAQDDAFIRPLGEDDKKSDCRSDVQIQPEMRNLRLQDSRPTFIQRSTSEKVPNRSELMSQVTRTAWARHTTK